MMELNLARVDYIQVGSTVPKCMKVLPKAPKESTNKVVIADNNGVVQSFGIKKKELHSVFKTMPSFAATCVQLGGQIGQLRDKIFVSRDTSLLGYTRKGKEFLEFNFNVTETIHSIFIDGNILLAIGNYIYHHYVDCHDVGYYLCSDQLNDVIALPMREKSITPILACKDRRLRILRDSQVLFEHDVCGPPGTLHLNGNNGGEEGDQVLFGTSDGQIGLVKICSLACEDMWQLNNEKRNGGILCLASHDITGNGVSDLLVSRDDGVIEVYDFDDSGEPQQRFSHTCNESVTSIEGGNIGSDSHVEVLCSSYSGWVMGFTTEPQHKGSVSSSVPRYGGKATVTSLPAAEDKVTSAKINELRKEIDDLTQRLQVERERYHTTAETSPTSISAVPCFNMNEKFVLNRDDASYTLCLEVQSPIDNVLVQSGVPVDILDVEKNSAVISFSACDANDGNFLLATYRCQANTTRLELKIRTIEGQHGFLQAYVTPKLKPLTCRLRQFQIKPLSMHQRINHFDPDRPLNTLHLTGTFSIAEMHSWITFCLPELPERTPAEDIIQFCFESAFLSTQLECCYRRNKAVIRSDNISTICILKDVLTKEATKKSMRLEVTCEVNDDSIPHVLTLLHPKLTAQIQLAQKVQVIEALKDLEVHESGDDWMTTENKEILKNAEQLLAENKRQPCHLERLYGIVTDLYIDTYKCKGQNVRNNVPQLISLLQNYDYNTLVKYFMTSSA